MKQRTRLFTPLTLVALVALAALEPDASAGNRATFPVQVDVTYRMASGAVGSARNSVDGQQSIYCFTNATSSSVYGYCAAMTAEGVFGSCFTTDATMLPLIQVMASDGVFAFYWDENGQCTDVLSYRGSLWDPKLP